MYKINDKVIFNVPFMRAPALGYVEDISGGMARCRLSVPLCGHTHANVYINDIKPTEELIEQREKERVAGITETLRKADPMSIQKIVEELINAKKV